MHPNTHYGKHFLFTLVNILVTDSLSCTSLASKEASVRLAHLCGVVNTWWFRSTYSGTGSEL